MIVIALISCKVDFSQEFLLMMLQFSDHLDLILADCIIFQVFAGKSKIIIIEVFRKRRNKFAGLTLKMYLSFDNNSSKFRTLKNGVTIMAPPRIQCLNIARNATKKGSNLRVAFSTSQIRRAGKMEVLLRNNINLTIFRRYSRPFFSFQLPSRPGGGVFNW